MQSSRWDAGAGAAGKVMVVMLLHLLPLLLLPPPPPPRPPQTLPLLAQRCRHYPPRDYCCGPLFLFPL